MRQELTDLGSQFDNILYQNQRMTQAGTEAARSGNDAESAGRSFETCFSVIHVMTQMRHLVLCQITHHEASRFWNIHNPDQVMLPRFLSHHILQRSPSLRNRRERWNRQPNKFSNQLRHMHRAKDRLTQAPGTVTICEREPNTSSCQVSIFSSCATWTELDET